MMTANGSISLERILQLDLDTKHLFSSCSNGSCTVNGTQYLLAAGGPNGSNLSINQTVEDDFLEEFNNVIGIWITGIFCLFGLTGNILSFLVLQRAHGHSPMFYVLRAVAVSDAVFLFTVLFIQTLVNLYQVTGTLEWCFNYRGYIQFVVWPIMMMTQMSTVWLTVFVSMERYVAIRHPLKAASICTIPKVRRCVIIIYVISVLYNLPRYMEYEVKNSNLIMKSDIGQHPVYRYLYTCILYGLLLFLVPLFLLIVLNLKLVLALQEGKKQWKTLQFRQKKEQNLTLIPLGIVLVFLICGTPALVVNVIDSINPSLALQSVRYLIFMLVGNLLIVLNSACNFIIYCMLGKKFRTQLIRMLRCHCTRYRAVYTMNTTVSDL